MVAVKAAVLHQPKDLRIEDADRPVAGPGELVLQVKACGVCGTDQRVYLGTKSRGIHFPCVIGHEIAGVVVDRGAGVSDFDTGDRVALVPVIPCMRCACCMRGLDNICLNRIAIGYEFEGGFQQYMTVPQIALKAGNVIRIPEQLSFDEAALIEPFACCVNGSQRSQIPPDGTVVIAGAGPIGLMHLKLAKAFGAAKVIVSEPARVRMEYARQMGADIVTDPTQDDLHQAVMDQTDGLGADSAIMAIGVPELVGQLAGMLRKGGTLNLFAGFQEDAQATITCNLIHYGQINVTGSAAASRQHFQQAMTLLESGKVTLSDLITHRFALENIHDALDMMTRGQGLKGIMLPA